MSSIDIRGFSCKPGAIAAAAHRANENAGTGLGLSVVHGIAVQHGGFLELGRAPSGGARISVGIPVAEAGGDSSDAFHRNLRMRTIS